MIIAEPPLKLSLSQKNSSVVTVLECRIIQYPCISTQTWQQRMADGKVHLHDGTLITAQSLFKPSSGYIIIEKLKTKPLFPLKKQYSFKTSRYYSPINLIFSQPHREAYVYECLQNRLRVRTGIEALQALHRLDRVTTGLIMFSVNPETRHRYHQLFEARQIHQCYQAIARINDGGTLIGQKWEVKNRIVRSEPRFRMRIDEGHPNSHSLIRCLKQST